MTRSSDAAGGDQDSLVILETAEKKLAELIAERDAVREAEALVDRIAEPVTLESEETISAARTAYNGLTVRQKEMYSPDRLTRLEALEAALAEKKKQAAEDAARGENREKIAAVEILIDAIGTVTKNSGPSITAARTAFDALSETLRARVGNYNVLLAAEAAYKRILTSGDRPTQGGGGVTLAAPSPAGTKGTTGTGTGGTTGTINDSGQTRPARPAPVRRSAKRPSRMSPARPAAGSRPASRPARIRRIPIPAPASAGSGG